MKNEEAENYSNGHESKLREWRSGTGFLESRICGSSRRGRLKRSYRTRASIRCFQCEILGQYARVQRRQSKSSLEKDANCINRNILQNRSATTNNNEDYLEKKFPTQTKRLNILADNNPFWKAESSSQLSRDIAVDSGVSERVVNNIAFHINME